tara:strand:- start:130 stop:417 length:288 start_codon:yes stop_codon:yes gene_type:complete
MDIKIGTMGGGYKGERPQLECKHCQVKFGDFESSDAWDKLGLHLVEHKNRGDNIVADIDGIYLTKLYYWSALASEEYAKVHQEREELKRQLKEPT